jgi:uncharacterized protein (DUF2267 family)
MQYDEFLKRVQQYTGLVSKDDVLTVIKATLETLGERISRKEREDFASQLPCELKDYFFTWPATKRFELEDFYTRVAARANVRYPLGIEYAQAVIRAVQEAVAPGELGDLLHEVDKDYRELFTRKPVGPDSPSLRQPETGNRG